VLLLKARALITVVRPLNAFMMVFALYIAAVVAKRGLLFPDFRLIAGFVTAFTLTAFAMVVNDIYDIEVDKVNEPDRPLPSGELSLKSAAIYAACLAFLGVLFSLIDGYTEFALASVSVLLSILYSKSLKLLGLVGNIAVSYNVALPFLYAGIIEGEVRPTLFIFFLLAFLSNTGREVIKGIAELKGDSVRRVKTIAATKGASFAAKVGALFSLFAVFLSPLPLFLGGVSRIGYAVPIVFTDALFVYLVLMLLRSTQNATKVKRLYKIPMLAALLSFLIGALV